MVKRDFMSNDATIFKKSLLKIMSQSTQNSALIIQNS